MKFSKTILSNGVRVITVPMQGNPTVTVMINIATGSFYETATESGISHFMEHMCFKGTATRPSVKAIATELDSIGAAYNAFTGNDITGYWVKADAAHFLKIGDIVSDIYINSTFPEKEIEKEKNVVIGEIDMYADDPQEKISDALRMHMYRGQPAERDVLGTKESVNAIRRDDLMLYRARQYVGSNTVVTIAGGVPESEMIAWARSTFNEAPSGDSAPEFPTHDKKQESPETVFIDKDTDQAHVVMGWRTFTRDNPDRYVAHIIKNILNGGMSSRLFIKLRDEMGSGYYIGVSSATSKTFGRFLVSTGTKAERVVEIVKAVLAEADRLKNEPVSHAELSKIKEFMRAHTLMALETSDDVADYAADQETLFGKIKTPEELKDIYSRINPDDIIRVSKLVFDRNRLNVAAIGKDIDKEGLKALLG